jgi:tetratricopeptide (TPR) repeat protein
MVSAIGTKVLAIGIHQRFLEMAYIEGDQAAVARETQWFAGKPEEYLSFGLQAAYRNVLGQRRESSKLYQRAAQTALHHGLGNVAAEFEEADARADALSGNCRTAHLLGRPALALAMCGDSAQAEKLVGETSKVSPNDTIWNAVQLPEIRAAIQIQRGQPAKAVELLASASPYERAYPDAPYLPGLAYLRLHKGAEAAAEFQKIVDHKGPSWGSTWQHPIGDSSTRFPTWGWRAPPRSRATRFNQTGTFFEMTPSGSFTTLHSFCSQSCSEGYNPSGVIQAAMGNSTGQRRPVGPTVTGPCSASRLAWRRLWKHGLPAVRQVRSSRS